MRLTAALHRNRQIKAGAVSTVFAGRRRTWGETADRVARLAAGLVSLGLGRGDRVAPIALNSDRYLELYFAVWWAGGVIVPGNTRWALPEHVYALNDSGACILLVDEHFAALAAPIREACGIATVVYMGEGAAPDGMVGFEALIEASAPMADAGGANDELCALFYTGGTTGRSKGVMLSHASLMGSSLCTSATAPNRHDAIFLHSAPMFHLADAAMIITMTMIGGAHVIVPGFTPAGVAEAIGREGITDLVLVPAMFAMLREHALAHGVTFEAVRQVTYGASPISESLLGATMEIFPNADFRQAYGQTELSPVATLLLGEFHRPQASGKSYLRSAGRAIVGVEVRIVDEAMNEAPLGEVGEVAVRSPGAMLGYWKQPDLTAQTLVDGWVRTGDAGTMDEEGFVWLVDRVKDMIVSGGENVYSAEVENALCAFPGVVECAVIGVPDERWGERVHAIVRCRDGAEVTSEALVAHCHTLLAGYKCPRSVDFRAEPLPLSGAGKILKTELREPYWPRDGRRIN
ncbi:MAG TPA: long-chain-fatty-acid--CoA ligase [Caulobacteraceae bacterium]|nr:long-chain-fatty-acid--CoA ligase [Caulobacteraceae bacterium]